MAADKTPGPDGFPMFFYQHFWEILKVDIVQAFQAFHRGEFSISKLNRALLCLIPKVDNANKISDYRPIGLLNCSYKIFTKVLANRMAVVLQRLIDINQTAFLKGRFNLDGVVTAHEILHWVQKHKDKGLLLKLDFAKAFNHVQWDFLLDILKQRGFSPTWIHWMSQVLKGGMVAVLINGVQGEYFNCQRGLRQGDPLSPYLFILVTDVLSKMLRKGMFHNQFAGLGPRLNQGTKVMHLQYADDTLLFLRADKEEVERVKWILKGFEGMSGLRINFAKSELIPLNLSDHRATVFASSLNCKLGALPFKYLGLPLHWKRPNRRNWLDVIDKIKKKLSSWKGNLLSLGGRLILINSVLSAIPLYFLSFFKVPKWVLLSFNRLRRTFLWGQKGEVKKLALVSWDTIARPKEMGGWGILNLELMNKALLGKWKWNIDYKGCTGLWKEILQIKYSHRVPSSFSPFWKGVWSMDQLVRLGTTKTVGNGKNTLFWLDTWFENYPLALRFPRLFQKTKKPRAKFCEVWFQGRIRLYLSRGNPSSLRAEKVQLLEILNGSSFPLEHDGICWHWESKGLFTVKSMYDFLSHRGIFDYTAKHLWKLKIPLKVKLFSWLVLNNRISTKDFLARRGMDVDLVCSFCDSNESVDHLFLTCSFTAVFWLFYNQTNKWGFLVEGGSFRENWLRAISLPKAKRIPVLTFFTAVIWSFWKERNNRVFNESVGSTAASICASIFSLFAFWTGTTTGMELDFHQAASGTTGTGAE
ncbi:RNA-directed DNA polymerase (reverse transcriptase)-related family protein [Rhynchospora pubera]|uniref:RNA-directed DNA polymerase (Reverse transcriptase)-related family protein n=1 Tax=Rhynchospora pubera TaxID=906938 RepID=A0AAV8HDJ6_9POAL|nr:RNA-directed DNA polymerase (reverse transcriptase)-related family protein [Rhynchospora pubera]